MGSAFEICWPHEGRHSLAPWMKGLPKSAFLCISRNVLPTIFHLRKKKHEKKVSGKTVTSEIPSPKQSVLLRGHLVEVEIDKLRALLGAVEATSLEALIQNDPTSD